MLWLGLCGCEAPEPVEVESPGPVARFPEGQEPAVLDARAEVYLHEEEGACGECHPAAAAAWSGSPHDRALDDPSTALGTFDGQPVVLPGLTATPLVEDGRSFIEVEDLSGRRRYEVRHTFGHDPLQQVLLAGDRGALWVAPVAWDVAGKRWFDPSVDGAVGDPSDPLYWAGLFGTWNHMCAACHSTGVVEGFEVASRSYATRSTHPDVACAACHGEGPAVRTLARGPEQVETCGSCHALREPLAPGWTPGAALLDHYLPALLDSPVYTAAGRIQDGREAFVWGSFAQSAMARAGVRCTHCHEPHGTGLRASGPALCAGCHGATYAEEDHADGASTGCVDCHMPASLYMGVDRRRDHGLHPDTRSRAGLVERARRGDPTTASALLAWSRDTTASPFHRASALALLRGLGPVIDPANLVAPLSDDEDLVRWQAAETLSAWGVTEALWPALDDPLRAVRFAAVKGLFGVDTAGVPGRPERRAEVGAELEAALLAEGDEPASHVNLGVMRALSGDLEGGIAALRTAVELAPSLPAARQTLAALLTQAGRSEEAAEVLSE